MPPKKPADQPTSKIPPVKVLSDDCAIEIGRVIEDGEIKTPGTKYNVHEGEWVELHPARSIAEVMALSDVKMIAEEGSGALDSLCLQLSERLISWNWTDNFGQPLPQPYQNPGVIKSLSDDEVMWLIGAAKGQETSTERKND